MVKMLKVTTDSRVEMVDVPLDGLRVLQGHVGGMIEYVPLDGKVAMWANEEGLFEADPQVNALASTIRGVHEDRNMGVVGDVLIFAEDPARMDDYADDPDLAVKVLGMLAERLKAAMLV